MSNAPKMQVTDGAMLCTESGLLHHSDVRLSSTRCAFKKHRRLETGGKVYPNNPAAAYNKEILTRARKEG